jgi:hypothetical protein
MARIEAQAPVEETRPIELAPALEDGYRVHAAILARGFDVLLLPRQVLVAGPAGEHPGLLSFVHGVPAASTLSAVTYAQDRRVRRAMLERAKLPTPTGATFSFRGLRDAQRYIKRLGYPIALKEVVGENPSVMVPNIRDDAELARAIEYLRLLPSQSSSTATSVTRSAYALTNLLEQEEDEAGRKLAAPRTRFLAERYLPGPCLRMLVLGGEVLATLHRPPRGDRRAAMPWDAEGGKAHPEFLDAPRKAAASLPGLAAASVDLIVEDIRKSPKEQKYYVVEISERPHLETYVAVYPDLDRVLGDAILMHELRRLGLAAGKPAASIAVEFRAESLPDAQAMTPLLARSCDRLGLTGYAGVRDLVEGVVEGVVQGDPHDIALIAEGLLNGAIGGQRAMVIEERQRAPEPLARFEDRGMER